MVSVIDELLHTDTAEARTTSNNVKLLTTAVVVDNLAKKVDEC